MQKALIKSDCPNLTLLGRGKVRDLYAIPGHDDKLLMVATDRISAFDVIMGEPIPGKGRMLTAISLFWFRLLADIMPNHLLASDVAEFPEVCRQYADQLEGRSMLVKKCRIVPIECIVRGYISGSFWSAYKKSPDGRVLGFSLPGGLKESDKLERPLFTPSTKAEAGAHDENISLETMRQQVGADLTERMAEAAVALYERAAEYARGKGIIIADTKFEMGLDEAGGLVLADEVLSPDSSRFWPLESWQPGRGQPSFDKQFLRDYLESLDWDKKAPAPPLPEEILQKTAERYQEALRRLTA